MAFFGSADSDHLVKQLRGQLAQKDFEIQTLINEQAKKDELFSETKRAKDDAMYKAQTEQERALKSERTLAKSNSELQNANMRLANLESTLNDAQNRHKKDEKEIDRLQYELDTRADSAAANARVQTTVNNLKEEIKNLKSELKRSEFAKETLENQARIGGSGGGFGGGGYGGHGGNGQERSTIISLEGELQALRRENLRLMEQDRSGGSSATPIRPRMQTSFHSSPAPRSKRALSFSGGTSQDKIQALEVEVETLRLQAMPGLDMKDVDKLRADLETAKRHAMKMENEKLAVERSIQREMEDIKSKLSDANDELNYLRAFDGQSVQQQLDVTKKSAGQERAALEEELQKRSDELEKRRIDVVRLEGRLRELESDSEGRQAEITALESQLEAAQKSSPGGADMEVMRSTITKLENDLAGKTVDCTSARERIMKLEAKLELAASTNATTAVAAPNDAQAAKLKRAHQREVDDLRRAKEDLERHLAESEELVTEREVEIFELKRHMPLPGEQTAEQDAESTGMTSEEVVQLKADLQVKVNHIDDLLQEKEQVGKDLRSVKAELEKAQSEHSLCGSAMKSLQDELSGKDDDVLKLVAKSEALSSELDARQEQIEALRTDSQGQDAILRTQLSTMEKELASLREASMQSDSLQGEFQILKDQLRDLEKRNAQLQEMETSLLDSHKSLEGMTQEKDALVREVSSANLQLEALRAELIAARSATETVATEKQALIEKKQREADSFAAEAKRKDSAYKELQGQMEELQNQLEDSDAEMCRLQEAVSKSAHLMEQYDGQTLRAERDSALTAQKQTQADLAELQRQQLTLCEDKSSLEAKADNLAEDVATLKDELEECQRLLSFADIEHGILEKALTTAQASKDISEAQAKRVIEKLKEAEETLAEQEESARTEQARIQDALSTLRDDHAALQLEHEDLIDCKRQLEVKLEGMTADYQRIEAESLSSRQQLETLASSSNDTALVDLHRRTQELEGRVVRRNQLIATEQAKLKKVEMNLDIATEDIEQLEAEITRLNNENVQLGEKTRALEAEAVERQSDLTAKIETFQREISGSRERESQLQSSLDEQSKELASLIEQLAQSANDVQAIMARTADDKERMSQESKAEQESIQTKARQEVDTLELVIAELEKKHAETQSNFEALVAKMENRSQEIESLRQSREAVEERLEAEMRKGEENSQQLAESVTRAEARAFENDQEIDRLRSENDNLISIVEESRQKLELQTQAITRSEELLASKELALRETEIRLQTDIQDDTGARAVLEQELKTARAELASSVVAGEALSVELQQAKEAYDQYVQSAKGTQEELAASNMAIEIQLQKVQQSHTEALASLEERSQALQTTEERSAALAAKLEEVERLSAALRDEKVQLAERSENLEQNLQAIVVEVQELRVDLATQTRLNAELAAQRAQAGLKVDELTRQIETQRIADEQLNKSLAVYSRDRFQALAENDQLREAQNSLQIQLETQIQALGMLQSESERTTSDKSRLEQALQAKTEEAIVLTGRYQKAHGLASTLTADATRLENKLADVVKKLASTEERFKALAIEKTEIEATAQAYKDEKNRLVEALEHANNESDEHMAQIKDMNKAKATLQRKFDKLERKIKTMAEAPPAPEVSATILASHPAGLNQDVVRLSPSSFAGQKRSRDDDTAPKKAVNMTEAVIAPSPFEITRTPAKRLDSTGKLGFTPTRHNMTPNMGAIPRSPYGRLHKGDENAFPAMAFMRGKIAPSILNQHPTGL